MKHRSISHVPVFKSIAKAAFSLFVALGLNSCEESPTIAGFTEAAEESGSVKLEIQSSQVGSIARAISLNKLVIKLSTDGETDLLDTVTISGSGSQNVARVYGDLASLKTWQVEATSFDANDSIIHQGSTTFDVVPADTADVLLNLDANYSMLQATFTPIRDSITSVNLLVDGISVADSAFAEGSLSDVSLGFDYLETTAPTEQTIRMEANGIYWGFPYLLYAGDTTISVIAGQDTSYNVLLKWVGPGEAPVGAATMTVALGSVGTVDVVGTIEGDTTAAVPGIVNSGTFLTLPSGPAVAGTVDNLQYSVDGGTNFHTLPAMTFSDNGISNAYIIRDAIEAITPGYVGQYSGQLYLANGGMAIQFAIAGTAVDAATAAANQTDLTTKTGLTADQLGTQAYLN